MFNIIDTKQEKNKIYCQEKGSALSSNSSFTLLAPLCVWFHKATPPCYSSDGLGCVADLVDDDEIIIVDAG